MLDLTAIGFAAIIVTMFFHGRVMGVYLLRFQITRQQLHGLESRH